MNFEQANQIDLVGYLHSLGHEPSKIKGNDYWYQSPLRDEKEPSFKVNRNKHVWYDHGLGKGGTLVDFTIEYFHCETIPEALQNLSFFQRQKIFQRNSNRPPFHSYEHNIFEGDTRETAIRIIAANQPIQNPILCRYLKQRKIEKNIANKYCYEVEFVNGSNDKRYFAINKFSEKLLGFDQEYAMAIYEDKLDLPVDENLKEQQISDFQLKSRRLVHVGEVTYSDINDPLSLAVSQTFKMEKAFSEIKLGCTEIVAPTIRPTLKDIAYTLEENKKIVIAGADSESMTYYIVPK